MRAIIDAEAAAADRTPPRLTVWVPVALDPGDAAILQLAAQLAVYLAPPGYGEMFCELGFLDLVRRARAGARRAELGEPTFPSSYSIRCAPWVRRRISPHGCRPTIRPAPTVWRSCPRTAEDPGGAATLNAVALRHSANQEM